MSDKETGGPAFPFPCEPNIHAGCSGMDLRDYFAAKIMQGMTASPELMEIVSAGSLMDGTAFYRMSKKAYELADAMLMARQS